MRSGDGRTRNLLILKQISDRRGLREMFLDVRMAYLDELRREGKSEGEMIGAVNVDCRGQVPLLLATWDDMTNGADTEGLDY